MIAMTIKLEGVAGLGFNSESLFRRNQMQRLGEFAIKTIRARVAKGVGSDDSAMLPLSAKSSPILKHGKFVRQRESYAQWKSKHGLQPIRDLAGTGQDGGHMLDNLTVRSVSESNVRMSLTARKARAKALSNEKRSPWLSFSDADEIKIMEYAAQMFHSQVDVIRRQVFQLRKAA
jgi:hypothetical protein